jgi:hypothetical protein
MDEVFIRIRGVRRYLWRALDQDRVVLDIIVQEKRDVGAAERFFKTLRALDMIFSARSRGGRALYQRCGGGEPCSLAVPAAVFCRR